MKLKIIQVSRLNSALKIISKGAPSSEGRVLPLLKTTNGRLKMIRNQRYMREALESAEQRLLERRDFLFEEERKVIPGADKLTGARLQEMQKFTVAVNSEEVDVPLQLFDPDDFDYTMVNGEEAFSAMADLEGVLAYTPESAEVVPVPVKK